MTTKAHKLMSGSDLHEPKGIELASSGQAYIANGAGSGVWQAINTDVAFSTGDMKPTIKSTADSGWVMLNDGTIGSATSGASTRANADCQSLFTLIWNNISSSYTTVSSGRGGSAAADWAANKTITLPRTLGRAISGAGTGSGLSARTVGQYGGEETHALVSAENGPHTHIINITSGNPNVNHTHAYGLTFATAPFGGSGTGNCVVNLSAGGATSASTTQVESAPHNHIVNGTSDNSGSGTGHNNIQPTLYVNWMIKL